MELLIGKSIGVYSFILVVAIATTNIAIKNGIHKKTFSELLSVIATSGITGLIVWFVCKKVDLKLFQDEVMRFNGVRSSSGVMFGLYVISTLGIFMEVVSRLIYHLDSEKDKTLDVSWKEQFKTGIDIGKKYINEKINEIIFIILSVSLFPICMNINNDMKFAEIFNQANIFSYLLIAIVANIGVLISVLITSSVYACFNRKKTIYKTVSENKLDGMRSLKL